MKGILASQMLTLARELIADSIQYDGHVTAEMKKVEKALANRE